MISTIYIEQEVAAHPRTAYILSRFPQAAVIECDRYTQVFNPSAQNFRLQKQKPSLILARKHKGWVLPTPTGYGVGSEVNYYFSHMLNCVYDCRYCFLQGMYSSANFVVFVNYEDFADEIVALARQHQHQSPWFFSGYDCDSMAFEPVTRFIDFCLPLFARLPNAFLEIRTKSTQLRSLLNIEPLANVVLAFSFTPEDFSAKFEHGVPSVSKRLQLLDRLQKQGWKIGLRFDPMIAYQNYQQSYGQLFNEVFAMLPQQAIHSVSIGEFRMPKAFHKRIKKLYPQEPMFNLATEDHDGMRLLATQDGGAMLAYCREQILNWVPKEKLFQC